MPSFLKEESNMTLTENGAATYKSTGSHCLDLFAAIGAIRSESDERIIARFVKAFAEDRDTAMKILFFGRDVRGGLGERRVFRVIVNWHADNEPTALRRNIALIPEYGRFDDLVPLIGTACEADAVEVIKKQLKKDMHSDSNVSLLAKWLPSVNASDRKTVLAGKRIAKLLGMSDVEYRKTLSALRKKIRIVENNLREKDYTFDYSAQPSKAMFKYRKAFLRNDAQRYSEFLSRVRSGAETMHTDTLMPYDIIAPCFNGWNAMKNLSDSERAVMDTTWNALENFAGDENALAVIDGSGSMYGWSSPEPAAVALSLGIYFAERNRGAFRNHFITFSEHPQLVEIKGRDIAEKVRCCAAYNEVANTDLQAVFELILNAALKHSVPQEEMPKRLYIISDMEFDCCIANGGVTNFAYAKKLFEDNGYSLPEIVFWNAASRNIQQPVTQNEAGVALVSGCTPRLFSMAAKGNLSPKAVMLDIIGSERYAPISA